MEMLPRVAFSNKSERKRMRVYEADTVQKHRDLIIFSCEILEVGVSATGPLANARTAGVTAGSAVVRPLWWVEREDPHTTTRVKSLCRYNANWMGDSPINCDFNEGGAT